MSNSTIIKLVKTVCLEYAGHIQQYAMGFCRYTSLQIRHFLVLAHSWSPLVQSQARNLSQGQRQGGFKYWAKAARRILKRSSSLWPSALKKQWQSTLHFLKTVLLIQSPGTLPQQLGPQQENTAQPQGNVCFMIMYPGPHLAS